MTKQRPEVSDVWKPTNDEQARARRRAETLAMGAAEIADASFVSSPRGIEVTLGNGLRISLPLDVLDIGALSGAADDDLRDIEIDSTSCQSLWFPRIAEGFSVSGFLVKLFQDAARLELNRSAARRTSAKKAVAARRNGRKGGRPKKHAAQRVKT